MQPICGVLDTGEPYALTVGKRKQTSAGRSEKRSRTMKEILIFIAFVGVWYLLQAYILPKMGVST